MRAEKDLICRDIAGIKRFVSFGSDIPKGWTPVREADGTLVPSDATAPRTIGNVDAAAVRADRLAAETDKQRAATAAAAEGLTVPSQDEPVVPVGSPEPDTAADVAAPEAPAEADAVEEPVAEQVDEKPAEDAPDADARKGRRSRR